MTDEPTYISWFAGIGGFDLAFDRQGFTRVGACEIDKFAREVYAARFGHAPEWEDINHVEAKDLHKADVWVGGQASLEASPTQADSFS